MREVSLSPSIDSSPAVAAVEVHNLRKEFRRRSRIPGDHRFGRTRRRMAPALRDVTFTVLRGECVAILGQNGSGKSTLVRLLSTLLLHDGGTATVFGHDVFTDERAVRLDARIAVLEERLSALERRLKTNSSNSSLPPSANPLGAPPPVLSRWPRYSSCWWVRKPRFSRATRKLLLSRMKRY
jgi:ABC-type glutathione transport system ATPase component